MENITLECCRICKSKKLIKILDLGEMSLTGVFEVDGKNVPKSKLALIFCENCSLVQLDKTYNQNEMFGEMYMYRSAVTQTMKNHFKEVIKIAETWIHSLKNKNILEIASNDGTLLNMINEQTSNIVAIDPSAKKYIDNYPNETNVYIDFFDESFLKKYNNHGKYDLIVSLAVFYDIDKPVNFAQTINNILNDDGIWITEQTSSATLIDKKCYDSICHEHLTYFSLETFEKICELSKLKIIDIYRNDINGGSFTIIISKQTSRHKQNDFNIEKYRKYEENLKLNKLKTWENFDNYVQDHKNELTKLIKKENKYGKLLGYGASTKGNVILQYLGIEDQDIEFILERDENKFGLRTPGSNIPIVSETDGKKLNPSSLLVFPWHFKEEIIQREEAFLKNGGKLIFPLPFIEEYKLT